MAINYEERAKIFKALGDANRLKIIDMLSCGEQCACMLLEELNITQPTLSHHMKLLSEVDVVKVRREGKWSYYELNRERLQDFEDFINILTRSKEDCICNNRSCK